ncbi:MAG: hypothetical protein NXI31_13915 [bacterium]|nr:hypothetical protein [bacterium]
MNLTTSTLLFLVTGTFATTVGAQSYYAKTERFFGGTQYGFGYETTATHPTTSYDKRYVYFHPGNYGANEAYAYTAPHQIDFYTYATQSAAVSDESRATAGWIFDDVVFTGPAPGTPVNATVQFEVFGALIAGSANAAARALTPRVVIRDAVSNAFVAQASGLTYAVADGTIQSASFNVLTGTVYRFEIEMRQHATGRQFTDASASSSVRLAAQPFALPVGFTADSPQANITGNGWTPSAVPQITPWLHRGNTIQAGQNLDLTLYGGAPSVLTVLAVGGAITPNGGVTFGPWASLEISNAWVLGVLFTDASGQWSNQLALPAGATGLPLAMQVAVFAGTTIDEVYSTNPVQFTVQ